MEAQVILSQHQTTQKIQRIAYEIFENNYKADTIVLAGIFDKGYYLAQWIKKYLNEFAPQIQIQLIKVELDKMAPTQSDIKSDKDLSFIRGHAVILIDDVLNSGKTLAYSLKPFLNVEVSKLQIAVLVDRGHKSFPVAADYVGYALSTSLKEHVEVVINEQSIEAVYLQ